jgi:hypothetical protein
VLRCDKKHNEKTEKNYPFVEALEKHWGRVEFVAIPIGHAGTTLLHTAANLPGRASLRPSVF